MESYVWIIFGPLCMLLVSYILAVVFSAFSLSFRWFQSEISFAISTICFIQQFIDLTTKPIERMIISVNSFGKLYWTFYFHWNNLPISTDKYNFFLGKKRVFIFCEIAYCLCDFRDSNWKQWTWGDFCHRKMRLMYQHGLYCGLLILWGVFIHTVNSASN